MILRICFSALFVLHTSAVEVLKPNVLFLFTDDQRADTIRALGNPSIDTPHLDSLAKRGVAFRNAYCMGSMQGAVCVPSRAMLMTGRTLFRVPEHLRGTATWPDAFGKAGYTTFITGKWHNSPESLLRSFQEIRSVFVGGMKAPDQLALSSRVGEQLSEGKHPGKHPVIAYADEAISSLERAPKSKPWLCYVSFNLPHDPKVAPQEYHQRYAERVPKLPANFLPMHPFNNGEMQVRDEKLLTWPRKEEVLRLHLADYYACVTFVDAQIGRIVAALEQRGDMENTIIVFTSDHGLALGSHGLMGKQNLYEHSMKSPLIIAGSGVKGGRESEAMCYLHDLYPTLADMAGIPEIPHSEGQSLLPVLRGDSDVARREIFTAYRDVQRALRDERWKLIRYPKIDRTQLFDLKDDPHEIKDLAANPAHAERLNTMLKALADAQKRDGDTAPLRVDHPAPAEWVPPALQ